MKAVYVKNLLPNSFIAKSVFNGKGQILLTAGTRVKLEHIKLLKCNYVLLVYIMDEKSKEIKTDVVLENLKEKTINEIPDVFKNIDKGDFISFEKTFHNVERLVEHIISEGAVNTNLYEVKVFDDYTYVHCVDTAIMATFLGLSIGYNDERLRNLCTSAILHDIGKLKIKKSLINKKDKLTVEEFNEIKKHSFFGYEMLSNAKTLSEEVKMGVLQHHERIDGKGYPAGISGNEICDFAKIISVCDVFTAVSANRSYRDRFDPKEAYELILSGSGTMFDKDIVQCFRDTFFVYPIGCSVKLSNGAKGKVIKQNKKFPDRPIVRTVDSNYKNSEVNLLEKPNLVIESIT